MSSSDPDPLDNRSFVGSSTNFLAELKRHLGDAIVSYERAAR